MNISRLNLKLNLNTGLIYIDQEKAYLGVYIGDNAILQKKWEGVLEKVKGRLKKNGCGFYLKCHTEDDSCK